MKDYEQFEPQLIKSAKGAYLELQNGRQIIDAISSWWCKSWGHQHPELKKALLEQLDRYEHVIGANTCQAPSALLAAKLATLCGPLNHVSYASDGSCAIEIALKMSVHAQQILGKTSRRHFMALNNGYHGETCLALSVSDLGLYRQPYESLLTPVTFLNQLPYVNNTQDPLWHDCSDYWPAIEAQLTPHADTLSALILEPILQGAGGMKIYSADFLRRIRKWTAAQGIHLIADEIMTGLGRTGMPLACHHAAVTADIICLGKNLTGGMLPLSAVVCSNDIYELFYDDYEKGNNFLHSHTYTGHALACQVALASLTLLQDDSMQRKIKTNSELMANLMKELAEQCSFITNVRHLGMMAAADLVAPEGNVSGRHGYRVFQEAIKLGAWLRPLGNTLYWLPPFICDTVTLKDLQSITLKALNKLYAVD